VHFRHVTCLREDALKVSVQMGQDIFVYI